MFGTQQFEDMASRPFFPVGKLLFWISLVAAQMAGLVVGQSFGVPAFLGMLLLHIFTAVLAFWFLYHLLVLKFLGIIEHRSGTKIEKPGVRRGLLYVVLIPLLMCALGFLVILFLSHSSV
jgi:hypothetical protein